MLFSLLNTIVVVEYLIDVISFVVKIYDGKNGENP